MKLYLLTESSLSQETVNRPHIKMGGESWGENKIRKKNGEQAHAFFCCATYIISEIEEKIYISKKVSSQMQSFTCPPATVRQPDTSCLLASSPTWTQ